VKRFPLDELHHKVVQASHLAHINRLNDVVVIHLGRKPPFFIEPFNIIGFLNKLFGQYFNRDGAIQRDLFGLIDNGHGPGPQFTKNFIAGNLAGDILAFPDYTSQPFNLGVCNELFIKKELLKCYGILGRAGFLFFDAMTHLRFRTQGLVNDHASKDRIVICHSTTGQGHPPVRELLLP